MANLIKTIKEYLMTLRRYARVAAFVVVVVALLTAVSLWYKVEYAVAPSTVELTEDVTAVVEGEVMSEATPVHIKIPKANVDAPFSAPLGLESDGEIEVPKGYDSVGYYENGPTPGELGPSVILGHVDSVTGPAVFFSLGQLKDGDEIEIQRVDGSIAVFAVTKLERPEQSSFPTREVYGDINHAGLRLITCTGVYDRDVLRYSHNLIVYAKLVATRAGE
jgi:LPXTG-site transpeptidase (sortase) family protein